MAKTIRINDVSHLGNKNICEVEVVYEFEHANCEIVLHEGKNRLIGNGKLRYDISPNEKYDYLNYFSAQDISMLKKLTGIEMEIRECSVRSPDDEKFICSGHIQQYVYVQRSDISFLYTLEKHKVMLIRKHHDTSISEPNLLLADIQSFNSLRQARLVEPELYLDFKQSNRLPIKEKNAVIKGMDEAYQKLKINLDDLKLAMFIFPNSSAKRTEFIETNEKLRKNRAE